MPVERPVLVIAAHPDDEVLGCGGTAARLVNEGREVHFAILGEGITSRHAQRDSADADQLARLHRQAHAAAAKVGVKNYTHHAGDLNVDHGVIHRAVLTATRPIAGQPVRDIYAFEVPSSTEWAFQRIEPAFRPNVFVDISGTIEAKIAAMECYESEARAFPHPRSPEALRAIATRWGSVVGCAAAEAFELVRSIRPRAD